MNGSVRYRRIVLIALVACGLMALSIAFVTPRKGVTLTLALVPLVMILVAFVPLSVTKIVKHRWATPITAAWIFSAIVATHFVGTRLIGFGHQCDRVVLVASVAGFCLINIIWVVGKLRQRVMIV